MNAPLVVLIGPPGAGKSRIGKRVARELGVRFLDTDRVIASQHGPIPAIFAQHGEAHFRMLEREAVREALLGMGGTGLDTNGAPEGDLVVALGGGAVLDPDTQSDLASHRVALIWVTADAVRNRLKSSKRPLLAGGIESWERLVDERRAIYESLADSVWDTSRRPVSRIANEVADWVRESAGLQKEQL